MPGDQDSTLYFVDSGQIKLVMLTPDGAECLLAILTEGDIFGEGCLAGQGERQETATAMTTAVVCAMPCAHFLPMLTRDGLLPGFIHYLAARIAAQQETIANLLTVDSALPTKSWQPWSARRDRESVRLCAGFWNWG